MSERHLGRELPDFTPPSPPGPERIEGLFMSLERLSPDHAHDLFRANGTDQPMWDYMPYGPFSSEPAYIRWVEDMAALSDPFFYAIRDRASDKAAGVAAYLRIAPDHGVIEIGHIALSPAMQRKAAASEALMRMIDWAFAAGYRRVEWKCNALNIPSRRAATRLGFSFEGLFRNHMVVKGRNRDSAWFAITDDDWPAVAAAYQAWLVPSNFDAEGRQVERLSDLTALTRPVPDPALAD
ncbi:GNAT family N-acetyltransferase [Paracoccus sp. p3-h83]|uniref:GNAT family N-acetyltransferase n=1 Tax=Paracoccus sp. p3-h83 TaxID=3342805 RepID=UPI0035B9026C